MEPYYYSRLNKEKQKAYYAIKEGLLSLAPSFAVPRLDGSELSELFGFVRLDCPEIFYAPTFTYRFYSQADSVEFVPEYLFKKKQIQEHQKAIEARIRKLLLQTTKLDEEGKEQFVHDFICQNVRYDKLKKPYSHEVIGPLTQGVGVCEGIAKTVKILCDALHIPCIVAMAHNNPDKGIRYRHAWNLVKVGGKWYHLDATFDNSLSKGTAARTPSGSNGEASAAAGMGVPPAVDIRYDYFNLGDRALFRDHETLVWAMPECTDNSKAYYQVKKLSFTKMEDVRKRTAQAVKKNKPLTFQWRGSYLTREVLQELCVLFEEEAAAREKDALISMNYPQAVFRLRFEPKTEEQGSEIVSGENTDREEENEHVSHALHWEQANEGETVEEE